MATYAKEKGFTVQTLSTDPVASQAVGGSWASAPNLNTARAHGNSSNQGTSTNTIYFGGYPPAPSRLAITESWNGSAWTEVNDLNEGRSNLGGAGVYTAALAFGGGTQPGQYHPVTTESWNGSTWTEVNDLNTPRRELSGAGLQTAAMAIGGNHAPSPRVANVEFWDGSSWSEGADLPIATSNQAASGLTTSGLAFGGYTEAYDNETFSYNGSAWSEVADMNTGRNNLGGSGSGTSALAIGGNSPSITANTEGFDGSSWTELNNLSTAKRSNSASGAAASGANDSITFGGDSPPSYAGENTTETWSAPAVFGKQVEGQLFFNSTSNAFKVTEKNIPGATWSSGGDLNTARGFLSTGIGTQTAAAVTAGYSSPPTTYYANTEEYDGSSWTESGDLPSGRYQGMGAGTQTAGLYAGGYSGSWPAHSETFYYNGSTWSDQSADLNTARDGLKGTGLQTAAIAAGGISGPGAAADDEVELWDGSSWTETTELNTARYSTNMSGTSTDALMAPGSSPPGHQIVVETWDGTSWTEVAELNTGRNNVINTNAPAGASAGTLIFGGQAQPPGSPNALAVTEIWNGSSWTEIGDLSTGRRNGAGFGSTGTALAAGGITSTYVATTEEFTAGLSNFTITSS